MKARVEKWREVNSTAFWTHLVLFSGCHLAWSCQPLGERCLYKHKLWTCSCPGRPYRHFLFALGAESRGSEWLGRYPSPSLVKENKTQEQSCLLKMGVNTTSCRRSRLRASLPVSWVSTYCPLFAPDFLPSLLSCSLSSFRPSEKPKHGSESKLFFIHFTSAVSEALQGLRRPSFHLSTFITQNTTCPSWFLERR